MLDQTSHFYPVYLHIHLWKAVTGIAATFCMHNRLKSQNSEQTFFLSFVSSKRLKNSTNNSVLLSAYKRNKIHSVPSLRLYTDWRVTEVWPEHWMVYQAVATTSRLHERSCSWKLCTGDTNYKPDGDFLTTFCVLYLQRATCSTFQTCILNSH